MSEDRQTKNAASEGTGAPDCSDGRCPTCRQRNSRAGERTMDDGSVIVWHCNVLGCSNSEDHPNATAHGRGIPRTVEPIVGSLEDEA